MHGQLNIKKKKMNGGWFIARGNFTSAPKNTCLARKVTDRRSSYLVEPASLQRVREKSYEINGLSSGLDHPKTAYEM